MRTTPVEVVNIGFHKTNAIEKAIYFLNKHQKTFEFILLKQNRIFVLTQKRYMT